MSELADFFLQAFDLFMILDMNFQSDGRRADEVRAFFASIGVQLGANC